MRTLSLLAARGYTLIEIVIVLLLLAIMVGLAAPSMSGMVRRAKLNGVMNQLRNDLYYARSLAVRGGARVEVEFVTQAGSNCLASYEVRVLSDPPRLAKRVNLSPEAAGLCLSQNGNNPLVFNSRGMPHGVAARSFVGSLGAMADTMRFSQAGRTYRRY